MQPYSPVRGFRVPSAPVLLLSLLSTLSSLAAAEDTPYSDQVCKPAVKSGDTLPPCVDIENIQVACTPNGTASIDLEAHAQCMCHGSFFQEWSACRQCLYFHGQLSERDVGFWQSAIGLASSSLCGFLGGSGSAPTAAFDVIFTDAQAQVTAPATGATTTSDRAPSDTAVSLYYTPSGALGPGSITGSAASATKTGSGSDSESDPATTSNGSSGQQSSGSSQQTTKMTTGGTQTTAASSSQTSSKTSGAVAISTGSGMALLGAVVGIAFSLL